MSNGKKEINNDSKNKSKKKILRLARILFVEILILLVLLLVILIIPDIKERVTGNVSEGDTIINEAESDRPDLLSPVPTSGEENGSGQTGDLGLTVTPTSQIDTTATPDPTQGTPELTMTPEEEAELACKVEADVKAAMYDYDVAIASIQEYDNYEDSELLVNAIETYEEQKAACKVWPDNTAITHIFFHSLIADTSLAFGPDSGTASGYNLYMTTIDEFKAILETLYRKGYVLVSIHDIASVKTASDGTKKMSADEIMLPEGKTPIVISQDDVNYYDYMDGEGFANKIVIGTDGKPTCEYIQADGTTVTGEYDLVPILNSFIKEHPDFSYKGAKAMLNITGYEGTLGYETQPGRYDKIEKFAGLTDAQKDEALLSEQEACKIVAKAMVADGWEFACHSYGHGNMQTNTVSKFQYDTNRWIEEVGSLLGGSDVYVYPFGADVCDWRECSGEKYEYLKERGFWYLCNVDSSLPYWVVLNDDYMRMGRINCDGEMMQLKSELLDFLFDSASILDITRPALIKDETGAYVNADYTWKNQ